MQFETVETFEVSWWIGTQVEAKKTEFLDTGPQLPLEADQFDWRRVDRKASLLVDGLMRVGYLHLNFGFTRYKMFLFNLIK